MRSTEQMMELILQIAQQEPRIRAVAMNGSRVNPAAPRDLFQDYDIVYLVESIEPFIQDHSWVDVFGERIIMQMPDESELPVDEDIVKFMYLMQLADGNRIDLRLQRMDHWQDYVEEDRLTVIVLDKDGVLPALEAPSDVDYWVKCPNVVAFHACCNEFWWVSTYIAKGLWRRELLYALDMLNQYVRPMLQQMLCWQVGSEHDFQVNTGKSGKYLPLYLDAAAWDRLLATYPLADVEAIWQSVFVMTELFDERSYVVAHRLGYVYDGGEAQRVRAYLNRVYNLPVDAEHM